MNDSNNFLLNVAMGALLAFLSIQMFNGGFVTMEKIEDTVRQVVVEELGGK